MIRLTIDPGCCQSQWGSGRKDRSRVRLYVLLRSVNPHLLGCTVPGCDNMVPFELLPVLSGKVYRHFKHTRPVDTVAEVERNTVTLHIGTGKPHKQPIASAIRQIALGDQARIVENVIAPSSRGADPAFERQSRQLGCRRQSVLYMDIRSGMDRLRRWAGGHD